MNFLWEFVGKNYKGLVNAFGGRAHFLNLVGLVLVVVGFLKMGNSTGFTTYAMIIGATCGLQTWRSVQSDKVPEGPK